MAQSGATAPLHYPGFVTDSQRDCNAPVALGCRQRRDLFEAVSQTREQARARYSPLESDRSLNVRPRCTIGPKRRSEFVSPVSGDTNRNAHPDQMTLSP